MSDSSVTWLDGRARRTFFIDNIFSELEILYHEFMRKTDDIPYGYGERTQVGHLAQAASKSGYFTIQDYDVNLHEKVQRSKKKRYRPDLHIWVPERGGAVHTCCFEVKAGGGDWIPIDAKGDLISRRVENRLKEANCQLTSHGHYEAYYRCALIALRVFCCLSKWEKWGKSPKSYYKKLDELRASFVSSLSDDNMEIKPNFWWQYFPPYSVIRNGCWVEEGKKQIPSPGVFWVGLFRRS